MEVRIASVTAFPSYIKLLISFVFILSFWTTDVSSFKGGARISLFLAHSICNYTQNEPANYLVANEANFSDGLPVNPKEYDGPGGYIKKIADSEYQITKTGGNPGLRWNYGLQCYVGTCAQNYKERSYKYLRCLALYSETEPTNFRGSNYDPDCNNPSWPCRCSICANDLCNDPSKFSCKPPHPCSPKPTPALPPPVPRTTTTTEATTEPRTFRPGPTLKPPKFSCYVAESCDAEATVEESHLPECVIAHMEDGSKKFSTQTGDQGDCVDGAEKCDFCFISKCNDPKKKCKR